jgi:hypothetical protein
MLALGPRWCLVRDVAVGVETLALGSRRHRWFRNVGAGVETSPLVLKRCHWGRYVAVGSETLTLGIPSSMAAAKEKKWIWTHRVSLPCPPRVILPLLPHPIWHLTIIEHNLVAHIPLERGGALAVARATM